MLKTKESLLKVNQELESAQTGRFLLANHDNLRVKRIEKISSSQTTCQPVDKAFIKALNQERKTLKKKRRHS